MREPLSIGWRKERYMLREAIRIVAYWRHNGPPPGEEPKPSMEAQRNAIKEITPLLQRDEVPSNPQPIKRRASNWLGDNSGFGKREWLGRGFGRDDGEIVARTLPPPPLDSVF